MFLSFFQSICLCVYLLIWQSVYIYTNLSFHLSCFPIFINLSVYLASCLYVYLFIFLPVHLSICESILLSNICPSICPYMQIHLYDHLSIYLSFYLSICRFVSLSLCLSVYWHFSISISTFIFLWWALNSCERKCYSEKENINNVLCLFYIFSKTIHGG